MAKAVLPCVVALVAALVSAGAPTQSGHDLFQQALVKERAEGNLQEAIDLYERIARDFPGDHALAAKALVQMGQCYEKLGKAGAKKAYERVIRDYADQAEPLQVARARLAALTSPSPTTLTVRRLENPPEDAWSAAPSRDGRYLSFVDWRTGDLTIRDLQTGNDRRLTTEGTLGMKDPPVYQQAAGSTWSPDGKQIAYVWYHSVRDKVQEVELRIVGVDGGKPRTLSHLGSGEGGCADWSPDGKQILASLTQHQSDGSVQMLLVSAADGSTRVLTEIKREIVSATIRFSPDGRHVVYDALPDEGAPERDIVLLSLETGQATSLVRHPADDFLLGWSADGQWLIFASDRAGALGLWVVEVSEGKAPGTPRLVKDGIGRIVPMGLTRQGTLFYCVVTATEDVYVADLDPETGRVMGPARKAIEQNEGGNYSPSYSPDGRFLAYVAKKGNSPYPTNLGNALCIRSLDTGDERVFYREIWKMGYRSIGGPRWSPDSRFITFAGFQSAYPTGVLRLDRTTGEIAPVVQGADEWTMSGAYGPDEKHFFVRGDRKDGVSQILVRNLETREERELYRFPRLERVKLSLSPDGHWLSFMNAGWGGVRSLKVIPASGGEAREVWSFGQTKTGTPGTSHTWSPDGRHILFGAPDPNDLPQWVLWRVRLEGGPPEKIGLTRRWGIFDLTVRPDGRQIAMAGRGGPSTSSQVWVIENFLPADTAGR